MKTLLKFIISIALVGAIGLTAIISANYGHFDSGIRYALQHYLSLKGLENKIYNLHFKQGLLLIDKIIIPVGEVEFILEGINSDISGSLSNFEYIADLNIDRISAYIKADAGEKKHKIIDYTKEYISTRLRADIKISPFRSYSNIYLKLSNITIPEFDIKSGIAEIKIEQNNEENDITSIVNLSQDSFWHNSYYSTSYNNFSSQASFKNIPVQFLGYIKKFLPEDDLCGFLSSSFQEGVIEKGEYSISLSEEDYKNNRPALDNLSADFFIREGVFEYHPDMPKIRNINLNANIKSSSAVLKLLNGDIAGVDFGGSVINVDLSEDRKEPSEVQKSSSGKKEECGKITARGSGNGKVSDLVKFIPEKVMKDLQAFGIDLGNLTGSSKVELHLELFINKLDQMNLLVEADIPSTDIDILYGRVSLRNAALKAKLLNNILTVKGLGQINGFDSEIDFSCDIESKDGNHTNLKVASNLILNDTKTKNQILSVFNKMHGEAVLNFEYYMKNGGNYFVLNSELKNMEISLSKLGINKPIGKKANLEITGQIDDSDQSCKDQNVCNQEDISNKQTQYNLEFRIVGDDNLDIQGNSKFNGDQFYLDIANLRNNQTDLKAKISYKINTDANEKIAVVLIGKQLDLHEFSVDEFFGNKFSSTKHTSQTSIEAKIDRVLLRNNIWLDDLNMQFTCDHLRCFKGYLRSNIGSRVIELDLKEFANRKAEIWKIKTTNAGAVLRAIGAYNKMKAGLLDLELMSTRVVAGDGTAVNSYFGNFRIKKFILTDTPIITRILSFVSLPGFVNVITNNTDIIFSAMDGEFTFDRNIIIVKEVMAIGPYFDFSLNGKINLETKYLDIYGHVTPELYGFSSIVKNVPFVGDFVIGNKSSAGLISTPYSIKQNY